MKLISNLKASFFFVKKMWRYSKVFYILELIKEIMQIGMIYITILFPKVILDSLKKENFRFTMMIVCAFAGISFTANTVVRWITIYTDRKNKQFREHLTIELANVAANITYSDLEAFSTKEQYELTKKCISRDSVVKILHSVFDSVFVLFTVSGILFIFSYLTWWLWILLIISMAVEIVCEIVRINYNYESYETQNVAEMHMMYFRDWMPHRDYAKEVRLYGMLPYIRKKTKYWIDELAEIQKKRMTKTFKALWWSHIANGILIFVVYTYIGILCLRQTLGPGDFLMAVAAVFELTRSAVRIAGIFLTMEEEGQYIQAFRLFLNKTGKQGEETIDMTGSPVISFENVFFQYPETSKNALSDLSITLEPGKKYGIVGPNGAGKSTFIKLLMGLYFPTKGHIYYNGTDIRNIKQDDYWKLFSTTFQDYKTFNFTVEENIAPLKQPSYDKCHEAADKAGILGKILSFPKKFNTTVGREYDEDGVELSTGEGQKLALARMIYKDAPIWILDEPTASLSPQSELELYERIQQLTKNKTVFFISHRLASCRQCDEILVFNENQLVERGTHEQLMIQKKLYHTLFTTQSKYYDKDYQGEGEDYETIL